MAEFETEEQQLDALRKWWEENGRGIVVGVVLGLGAVGGWRGWLYYTEQQSLAASSVYDTIIRAIADEKFDTVSAAARELMDDYSGTPYAQLGALGDARAAVATEDYDRARQSLEWAIENARQDDIKHIARLRMARVLRQQEQFDEALATLNTSFPSAFEAAAEELRGDLFLAKGETGKARDAYRRALAAPFSSVNRAVLEMKFNDLRPDATS